MAVGRISEIVGAVKGFTYLDQAPVQRVDVRTGLEQTLVILRHRLRDGIELRSELAEDLPEIEGYGSELNQVWTNLVENAIDAMDGRGTLSLGAEPDPGGDGVRVSVCDTGPGIAPDFRRRMFEPFATTKPPGKGTGLGLHIVAHHRRAPRRPHRRRLCAGPNLLRRQPSGAASVVGSASACHTGGIERARSAGSVSMKAAMPSSRRWSPNSKSSTMKWTL